MSAMCIPDLLPLFKARREHCRALLELSRRQRDLIAADDYTRLLAVLGQKQRVLGRLDELNRQHPDLARQWRVHREHVAPQDREDCEHVLAETEALFAELLNEEQESTEHLTLRREATRRQLQEISQGTQAHQAYRDHLGSATHRHLDVDQ